MHSFLLKFMSTEQRSWWYLYVHWDGTFYCQNMHPGCHDLPQNSLAWISAQASSLQSADIGTRALPVSGCEGGSTATSDMAHLMEPACSQISQFIWQMKTIIKLPWWQIIAWFALNEAPQTQWLWTLVDISHPYLNYNASRNSCLFK